MNNALKITFHTWGKSSTKLVLRLEYNILSKCLWLFQNHENIKENFNLEIYSNLKDIVRSIKYYDDI